MAFGCDLRIIRAKNIELNSNESLFVRCFISTGKNSTIKLNTHEISSKCNSIWNQTFSLECFGNKSYNDLFQTFIVFELHKRVTVPFFGKIRKPILLGRAEVPWKSVFEAKELAIEKRLFMTVKSGWVGEDVKPPAIQVAMKLVGFSAAEEMASEKSRRLRKQACSSECECSSCRHCDMYAFD